MQENYWAAGYGWLLHCCALSLKYEVGLKSHLKKIPCRNKDYICMKCKAILKF